MASLALDGRMKGERVLCDTSERHQGFLLVGGRPLRTSRPKNGLAYRSDMGYVPKLMLATVRRFKDSVPSRTFRRTTSL